MNSFEQAGLRQLQSGKFPHDTQMAFERADLQEDFAWFNTHWKQYKNEMCCHALASYGCFQWEGFRKWLEEGKGEDKDKEICLENFRKHPAWSGA